LRVHISHRQVFPLSATNDAANQRKELTAAEQRCGVGVFQQTPRANITNLVIDSTVQLLKIDARGKFNSKAAMSYPPLPKP
jgi:hypothetical protein